MKLRIDIDLDNDAFKPRPHSELSSILFGLAEDVLLADHPLIPRGAEPGDPPQSIKLRDSNGNTVGSVEVIP